MRGLVVLVGLAENGTIGTFVPMQLIGLAIISGTSELISTPSVGTAMAELEGNSRVRFNSPISSPSWKLTSTGVATEGVEGKRVGSSYSNRILNLAEEKKFKFALSIYWLDLKRNLLSLTLKCLLTKKVLSSKSYNL